MRGRRNVCRLPGGGSRLFGVLPACHPFECRMRRAYLLRQCQRWWWLCCRVSFAGRLFIVGLAVMRYVSSIVLATGVAIAGCVCGARWVVRSRRGCEHWFPIKSLPLLLVVLMVGSVKSGSQVSIECVIVRRRRLPQSCLCVRMA